MNRYMYMSNVQTAVLKSFDLIWGKLWCMAVSVVCMKVLHDEDFVFKEIK